MNRAYKTIGLLDHMGYGNMGDAAIQESFIANIRKRLPGTHLIGFSLYPDDTRKRHGIESYPITWCHPGSNETHVPIRKASHLRSRFKLFVKSCRTVYAFAKPVHDCIQEVVFLIRSYSVVKSLDLLVMSGGGQLCELYGRLPYNVFKFCALAKLSNTPVFLVGIGADLLKRPSNKWFARWAVRLANYASFRSLESQALIRQLGVKKQTHVCPDPAYALDIQDYLTSPRSDSLTAVDARALLRNSGCKLQDYTPVKTSKTTALKVGLNPVGFCDPRRWPRKDDTVYQRYLDNVASFSSWLLGQNYSVDIFSSDISGDFYAIEDLSNKLLSESVVSRRAGVTVSPFVTLKDLLDQMSTFDFVVTSRFHGVIFSHLLAKPVIALSYLPKIQDLMRTVGHDEYCLDIEHFDVETLIGRFKVLVQDRDRLVSLFRGKSEEYSGALHTHFDRLFSGKIQSRHRPASR